VGTSVSIIIFKKIVCFYLLSCPLAVLELSSAITGGVGGGEGASMEKRKVCCLRSPFVSVSKSLHNIH